jgi:putative ABC transport system permease protein
MGVGLLQLVRRAWHFIRQRRCEADLADEFEFHRAMIEDDLEGRGLDSAAAAWAARRAMGSVTLAQDRSRDVWFPRWLQGLGQDCRLAVRTLLTTKVVTIVAVLSLALGLGANTALFSLVNSLLLRALPVADPQRLAVFADARGVTSPWTFAMWEQVRQRSQMFDGTLAWGTDQFNLAVRGEMQTVDGLYASGDFFAALGVPAIIGRTLTTADDVRGGGPDGPVAVISDGFWQRHFGGAPGALGSTLVLDHVPFTIVGVTPPGFFGAEVGRTFDVAVPTGTEPLIHGKDAWLDRKTIAWLTVMVRLKAGQSMEAATAWLHREQPAIREAVMPPQWPEALRATFMRDPLTLVPAAVGNTTGFGLRARYQQPLLAMFGVVALVLLIACANVANLLLARATARHHELSLRLALGAPRWRLARQLLVESLVLSAAGAVGGLAFAWWGSRLLVAQLSTSVNHVFLDPSFDWRVLAFTAGVTVATSLLFGTAPAFKATRVPPLGSLKDHGRDGSSGRHLRLANGLVVAQVALSLVLVVAAGLFVRTFEQLASRPLGFDPDRVLVVEINLARAQVDPAGRVALYDQLAESISALPGVAHAGGSFVTPLSGTGGSDFIDVPGAPAMPDRDRIARHNYVTPGWFAAYGTPILRGRDVDKSDTATAPPVVIVNDAFARKLFPGVDPIGRTIVIRPERVGNAQVQRTIVGVVGNAIYQSVREDFASRPILYLPLPQVHESFPIATIQISVRAAAGSPVALSRSVTSALAAINPDLTFRFRPLTEQVNASLIQERLVAMLAGFFGALALLLAALGLYGVTAYAVSRRQVEMGIRLALGAAPAGVLGLVMSRVLTLVAVGVVAGAALSAWASRLVASLLYDVEPRDLRTLAGASLVLVVVATLAAWFPARRASRIDPAITLRCN